MGPGRHLGHVRRRDARVVLPLLPLDRSARSGKSPSCPRSIFRVRFAVEPYLILQPCASRDGGRRSVQDQGARGRLALGAFHYGPWPRRRYVDGGAPRQATPWRSSIHAAVRLCALPRLLCQSHRALNSCAKLKRPAGRARTVDCTPRVMSEGVFELVWAELGTFMKKGSDKEDTLFIGVLRECRIRGVGGDKTGPFKRSAVSHHGPNRNSAQKPKGKAPPPAPAAPLLSQGLWAI